MFPLDSSTHSSYSEEKLLLAQGNEVKIMITKETLKREIENLRDEYLEIVYRILKAFEMPKRDVDVHPETLHTQSEWDHFIQETYGCLADAPIERGDQGEFEVRETL